MKYRISKYNIFPSHIEDEDTPTYAVEKKKHWWSRWKSMYWDEGVFGERVPKLFKKSEALEMYYTLMRIHCVSCAHCYGLVGEAEWGYRRCKVRRALDGESDRIVMNSHIACCMFQGRSE